jgi:hypothetical protein
MVIQRPITPTPEEEASDDPQKPTPVKNKVRVVTQFCQDNNVDISQQRIFNWAVVKRRTGYRYLQPGQDSRRHHNSPYTIEQRGRKPKITDDDFTIIEDWLLEGGFEHRVCTWLEIWTELFPKRSVHENTICTAFQDRGYHKCVACQKPFLTPQSIAQRREFLTLRRSWNLRQWRKVRFSDECHFGRGPQRKLSIIRRSGDRYHPDCIQKTYNEKTIKYKNEKRWHVWAAVGYDFKSKLIFYETSSSNGKMTGRVYIDLILTEVKKWIDRGDDFILEEDKDSAHGVGENSAVRAYKQEIGLEYFFNASGSPDLSPIENIWRAQKQKIKAIDHFDDDTLVAAIHRCWDEISMTTVNKYIDSMTRRMESLARHRGEMTEF